jgi:cell division septal protein FtsQ
VTSPSWGRRCWNGFRLVSRKSAKGKAAPIGQRLTRKGLYWLAAVAGAVLIALALPVALRQSSFFRVRRVEVSGTRYLTGPEVVAALKLRKNTSLFDPIGPVEQAALRIVGVRRVKATRRWPGTIELRLEEWEPVALTPRQSALALLDGNGRILPFDPTRAPADLPLAPADPAVARLMARIKDNEPALFQAIVSVSRQSKMVVFDAGERRFLLNTDSGVGQIQALAAVMEDLARKGRRYAELDARFTDRVFVRGKPS